MQKIKCPACNKDTFEAKYCMHCHAQLHRKTETPIDETHLAPIVMQAKKAHGEHSALTLVNIGVTDQLPDGSLPNIKKLTVPTGAFTVMVSQVRAPQVLSPGEYDASRLGVGGGLGTSLAAGNEVRPLYLCTVSQRPIMTTFALPDHDALTSESETGQEDDHRAAIRALSFRTADSMLGGVSVQMILRCVNPGRVLDMFFTAKLAEMQQRASLLATKQAGAELAREKLKQAGAVLTQDELRLANTSLAPEESQYLNTCKTLGLVEGQAPENAGLFGRVFKYPWELVRWVLWGGRPKTGGLAALPGKITLADLYPQIRTELPAAISESIRNDNVDALYRTVEVQDRVADDIQRLMSRSFEVCGIKVDRVAAFRFICPEYEELLVHRGQITLDRADLNDRNQEAKVDRLRREIEAGSARHASTTEREIEAHMASDKAALERHKIRESRETERDYAELQTERQQRLLDRDGIVHEYRLGKAKATEEVKLQLKAQRDRQQQLLQDERERLELKRQDERLDMAFRWQGRMLELQNSERDAAMARRIKMIETYSQLPKDSVLTIALAENPQLAAAYAESMKAQTQQDTTQMQERFRDELARAYAGNNQQFALLLQEAVRQWGQYQSAKQIGQQPPQQVINVALPKPTDGPSTGPDDSSKD